MGERERDELRKKGPAFLENTDWERENDRGESEKETKNKNKNDKIANGAE